MTPSEKHLETALDALIKAGAVHLNHAAVEVIARALAQAERDGMKRAAEIATEYAGENGPVSEFDDEGYCLETTALTIAANILSEAGED